MTTDQPAGTKTATCKFPGCTNPTAPADKPGRPPGFCELEEHNKLSAWRERQRLDAEERGDVVNDAQQAQKPGHLLADRRHAELLRQLRAHAERQEARQRPADGRPGTGSATRPPPRSRSPRRAPWLG